MGKQRVPSELRRGNRSEVLRELLRRGGLSRAELAAHTGLTGAAITRITRELIEVGLLREGAKQARSGQPGRRGTLLDFADDGAWVIGLGIHASDHSVVLANLRGQVARRIVIPSSILSDPGATLAHAREAIRSLVGEARERGDAVLGMGVATAGSVDSEARAVRSIPQFGWQDVALDTWLAELGVPYFVENVNDTLNLAEWRFGVCAGANDVVMLRISTFAGGSAISGGRLLRGANARAMQIGHLADPKGTLRCICGRVGCLNTTASGAAIVHAAEQGDWDAVLGGDFDPVNDALDRVIDRAERGDNRASAVLAHAGSMLGRGVAQIVRILDPEVLVLGGLVSRSRAFRVAAVEALRNASGNDETGLPRFAISEMLVSQATVFTALERYAFSPELDIGVLRSRTDGRRRRSAATSLVPTERHA
ncbi:MAG: ROK family transcriptional regulator [Burkholderiaceae bacterium]